MKQATTFAKPPAPRARGVVVKSIDVRLAPSPAPAAPAGPAAAFIVPSAPRMFRLGQLRRATENVRHTRVDEDCDALADDIEAHGLLQSLIGYEDGAFIEVVGGGRRLKALRIVRARGHIDDDFTVPVLIRGVDEAVELSLAENLQQRTMSPVDEFFAFSLLMKDGASSPAGLAKRFGFSERVVKQRLRLADLAPEILQALADREITLDAAMAYASSQDRALQTEVFEVQNKKVDHKAHRAPDVRHALRLKGIDTADRLYRFVGAERYEAEGGTYEDDLFADPGRDRVLAQPFLLETLANGKADFQALRLVDELRTSDDWAPTIAGAVSIPDLRAHGWGTQKPMSPPLGFVLIERADHAKLWRTIRNNGWKVHVVVGIDDAGALVAVPRYAFVPTGQKAAVDKPLLVDQYAAKATPEQDAAAARERAILRFARHLAVGPFAGTPFEGRTHWPSATSDRAIAGEIDGVSGFMVPVYVFVTDDEVAGQRKAAAAEYDAQQASQQPAEGAAA